MCFHSKRPVSTEEPLLHIFKIKEGIFLFMSKLNGRPKPCGAYIRSKVKHKRPKKSRPPLLFKIFENNFGSLFARQGTLGETKVS